jgi:hypothetical protein
MPPATPDQLAVCKRFRLTPDPPGHETKLGVARSVRALDIWPLHGLRHPPAKDTNGWYLWAGGEPRTDEHFFEPVHIEHLAELRPELAPYLALPPGWRFLIAPGHEDVWQDPALLNT